MQTQENKGLNISVKSFITAIAVVLVLMILTYGLTFVIPGGEYSRVADESGNLVINSSSDFAYVDGGIPFWKWILSPVLVLGADGGGMMIAIIVFLLVIGGIFNSLEKCGLMKYMLEKIVKKFADARYKLMAILSFFFMAMGALIGSFEECVPMVPIVVALSISLGWDAVTGMGMSLLAVGCGFASGVFNPFTVGVAQSLADLPMFSGVWLRFLSFVLIYCLLLAFLIHYAKKVDTFDSSKVIQQDFQENKKMDSALKLFIGIVGLGILLVLSSGFITALQDYTMIIVAVMFLIAGITAVLVSGVKAKILGKDFVKGMVTILPAVFLIMMAGSIKYTLTESNVLDTILYWAVSLADDLPKWLVILFIYLLVLVLNFFISSGSAKAFLLIPLIVPLAQMFEISPQLCVVAFAFGDGFSNTFYPTNAALLISLGLANVSYGKWAKYSFKFQFMNLILTSALLMLGLAVGYN